MTAFLLYTVKLSLCLMMFYLGYKVLLSRETFFQFNRKILLSGLIIGAMLPLIKIRTASVGILQQPVLQLEMILAEEGYFRQMALNPETDSFPAVLDKRIWQAFLYHLPALIFLTGCLVNGCLLISSHISLCWQIHRGRKIRKDGYTIVLFNKSMLPFNYGRFIFLSETDYRNHPEPILTHELAHLRFFHSFDIALIELMTLIQWFNPFFWALKNEIRQVHEFQADAEVLHSGIDATRYKLLLVNKAVDSKIYAVVNGFNHSKLKIRIMMMSKKQSKSWARWKLLLLIPAGALSVYAFARHDVTWQLEHSIQSVVTTTPLNDPIFTPEYFEAELNKHIGALGGNESLSDTEKVELLYEKTNLISLYINGKNEVFWGYPKTGLNTKKQHDILKENVIEQLQSLLSKHLKADYTNQKPVSIHMMYDLGSSPDVIKEVFQMIGKTFSDNNEQFAQKNQPVLLLLGKPKNYFR